jgi:hypothetical protein
VDLNELKGVVREVIQESSLSRIHQHVSEHDCAIITAFRGDPSDHSSCIHDNTPSSYQADNLQKLDINKLNNRDLKATLLKLGYGVTAVDGTFVEKFDTPDAIEVKEDSLFVVNLQDDPSFYDQIKVLGKKYCQDSILVVPQGGKDVKLYGTNNSQFPGLDQEVSVGDMKYGRSAEFMTKVRNRPISTNEGLETYSKLPRLQKMAVSAIAKKVLG